MSNVILIFVFLFYAAFNYSIASNKLLSSLDNPVEELLVDYDPLLAKTAFDKIVAYKANKDISPLALTDVARTIFLMYGLNPDDVTASYGGTISKAVINKSSGKIEIFVSERRDERLEHYMKAYGDDTFFHEILHALGFKWKIKYQLKNHGLIHSDTKEKLYFDKCRKILVAVIFDRTIDDKFRQKFDDLIKKDKKTTGKDEQVNKYIVDKYIKSLLSKII